MNNLGQRCLDADLGRSFGALKALQRLSRLLELVHPNEVPGGFGCETEDGDQESRPHPLQRKGNPVPPLVRSIDQAGQDARGDELPDDEAHVCPTGKVHAEAQGQHLGRIRRRRGDKHTPRQTAKELAEKEHDNVLGKKGNEDGTREGDEGGNDCSLLAEPGHKPAAGQSTNEASHGTGIAEASLPRSSQLVPPVVVDELAVSFCKLRVGVEVTDQDLIITYKDTLSEFALHFHGPPFRGINQTYLP